MKQFREVRLKDLITYLPISALILSAIWILFAFFVVKSPWYFFWPALLLSVVLSYYLLKRMAIGAVLFYKAFAPMEIRDKCRWCDYFSVRLLFHRKIQTFR